MSKLNDEITALTGVDFFARLGKLRDATAKAYRLRAEKEYLAEMRKVVLAEVQRNILVAAGGSVARAEVDARSSDVYREHLKEMREASELWADAEAERVATLEAVGVGRSFLSYEKKQLEVSGYE